MTTNILIVEDEPAIQEMITYSLQNAGYNVLQADKAEQALSMIKNKLPDLILLDWMLPGMNGIEFAKILRSDLRTKLIPIIMLTARAEEADKVKGLEVGADDYVTKPFSPRELIARIKAVLRRRSPELSGEKIEINGLCVDPAIHAVSVNGQEIALGPTEYRLLHFMMSHADRVYSRSQLLDKVWGDHVFIEERTVDVHIRRLRKVLKTVEKDQLLQTVRGAGYRFSLSKSNS